MSVLVEMFPTFTLSPQFGQLCKPSTQVKLEHEARKNWDLFYKRNTTHFFKDRHWLTREFPQLVEANNVSPNIPADQSPNYFISMIFLNSLFLPTTPDVVLHSIRTPYIPNNALCLSLFPPSLIS